MGKMAAPEKIFAKINDFFVQQNLLKNQNIIITGGGTVEPIDPVRFIGNNSSGKQAIAIASQLHEMGANVTLVAANIAPELINLPSEKIVKVKTAEEMLAAVQKLQKNRTDIFIACAAVADFRVKNFSSQKIKKSD